MTSANLSILAFISTGFSSAPPSVKIFLSVLVIAIILDLDGKKHNVLIHDLSKDILTGETTHVDFYEVRMDEKIKTKIPPKI